MRTITHKEIELAIKIMMDDWKTHKDINFVKATCNHLSWEIQKLEKEKEQ